MRVPNVILVLAFGSTLSCATAPDPNSAEIVPTGAGRPQLIGCTGYTPSQTPWTLNNRVWVDVTVLPDGSVEPASARARLTRYNRGGPTAIQRAVDMASSCSFKPMREKTETTIQLAFN